MVVAGNNYNDSYQSTTTVTPSPYSPTFQQDANKLFTGYFNLNWPIRDNDTETLKKLLDVYPLGDFDNNYDRVAQAAQDVLFAWFVPLAVVVADNGSLVRVILLQLLTMVPGTNSSIQCPQHIMRRVSERF